MVVAGRVRRDGSWPSNGCPWVDPDDARGVKDYVSPPNQDGEGVFAVLRNLSKRQELASLVYVGVVWLDEPPVSISPINPTSVTEPTSIPFGHRGVDGEVTEYW
jgi:hypothetical protein